MSPLPFFRKKSVLPERPPVPIKSSRSTGFSLRLFESLEPGKENLVICPYGVRVLLSMIWAGAIGETRVEMARALSLDENPELHANHYERVGRPLDFQLDLERLGLELYTANALWCDIGFLPKPSFTKVVKHEYGAQVESLDFGAPGSSAHINSWTSERTRGRIPVIVNSLQESRPLIATNAVYFKGLWTEPFEKKLTTEEEFTLPDARKFLTPMMRRSGTFSYREINGTQIVGLPYRGGLQMLIVLPPADISFSKFCSQITGSLGTDWVGRLDIRDGKLTFPRFCIETTTSLVEPLTRMGMARIFDPYQALLGGISDEAQFFLKDLIQRDLVRVNEQGTEAAAVTAMVVLGMARPQRPRPPFRMIVNRPFIFAICDSSSDTIVFLGAVVDPRGRSFS